MKTNVWIIVNFLLCLNTPKLGIRQLFLKPLESWPSIVVGDGEWWWLWSLLVVHYTFRGTLLPQHFPLKNMGKPLLPFSIGKPLGRGWVSESFFKKISPCLRRSRREASGLVASATSSAEWRPLWRLDQNRKLPTKLSVTQARIMCEWALYHIFPLSVESVVNTERAPGFPEGIDDADKKWGGLFLSRQHSESLSHRWFSSSRWRTEKENFLFPD